MLFFFWQHVSSLLLFTNKFIHSLTDWTRSHTVGLCSLPRTPYVCFPRFQITRRPSSITRQRKPNGACVWHPLPMTRKDGRTSSPIFSGNPLCSRRTLAFAKLKDMTKCRTFWPPLSFRNMQLNSIIAFFPGVCNQIISNINYILCIYII